MSFNKSGNVGNSVIFYDVDIYEGTYVTTKYTVDTSNPDQRFLLVDPRADTTTLTVKIQNSSSDTTTTTFTKATDITQLTTTSDVYFLQEVESGKFEIYFGDGIIGDAVDEGNVVILSYVVTNAAAANGAVAFTAGGGISGFSDITVTVISGAAGGAVSETMESIKLSAPFSYAAQNRTVTAKDYAAIVPTIYPNVESISVWGGEYNNPAVYGKVYISIRPKAGNTLTESTKTSIVSTLENYNVASVTPVILDPETTKIIPTVNFKYNSTITAKTSANLASLITAAIGTWSDDNLEKHESIFRYSPFTTMIDEVDPAILSNITTIKMSKTFKPTLGVDTAYTINFENNLYHPHSGHAASTAGITAGGILSSSGFKYTGDSTNVWYYEDDGAGLIKAYYVSGSVKVYKAAAVGAVTYTTDGTTTGGTIVLTKEDIASVENYDGIAQTYIRITVQPDSNDIVPVRNQILAIDTTNMVVDGVVDTISSGASDAGVNYATVSSYNP